MLDPVLLDVFARSYDPPQWLVEELQQSTDPRVRVAVDEALEAVPVDAIDSLDDDTHAILEVTFKTSDRVLRAKLHLLACLAASELQRARIALLGSTASRPQPYDVPVLSDVRVDDEGLVPLSAFRIEGDALCRGGHAFFILPAVPHANANYWLLQNIQRHNLVDAMSVRLDPILHGPEGDLAGHFYRMDVYGRPLDWDRIRELRESEHGRWMPSSLSSSTLFTDYAWIPHDDEVDFVCEELPALSEAGERGARYLHAVFDKPSDRLTHLDGAVRTYTSFELETRARAHVRNAGKLGRRTKVFRTDKAITPSALGDLAQAFFVWNYDVARYFGRNVPDAL